jgi:hypothetical protein
MSFTVLLSSWHAATMRPPHVNVIEFSPETQFAPQDSSLWSKSSTAFAVAEAATFELSYSKFSLWLTDTFEMGQAFRGRCLPPLEANVFRVSRIEMAANLALVVDCKNWTKLDWAGPDAWAFMSRNPDPTYWSRAG